jgi:Ca-activated chloride channel family protein
MRRAAEAGRGTFTYIGRVQDVGQAMGELFAKLESPVLTGLEVTWSDPGAEAWPARVPDLYRGEPIVVAARLPGGGTAVGGGSVEIRGTRGGVPWRATERLDGGDGRPGVARLWARRKIAALMGQEVGGAPPDQVDPIRAQVVRVALAHHLVSKYTSLVAVDVTPAAPAGTIPRTRELPVNLPAGWSSGEVVGGLPQTATPAPLLRLLGLLALAGALLVGGLGRRS